MHPNPAFRQTETQLARDFARSRGFGMLCLSTGGVPLISHVPFLLSQSGTEAHLHLVRSNPICRACTAPQPATLAVTGPDGYVSPDWYEMEDQVPTWNYVAVHLRGTLHPLPVEDLEEVLAAQSAEYEARLPKTPWTMDKMTADAKARLMRMILPFRLDVAEVQSTFKLTQNKPETARLGAAEAMPGSLGSDLCRLAEMMRHLPGQD